MIEEFYHSLNRKLVILNDETGQEITEALRQLEELGEQWKYVNM